MSKSARITCKSYRAQAGWEDCRQALQSADSAEGDFASTMAGAHPWEVREVCLRPVLWEEFNLLDLEEVDRILMDVSFATCVLDPYLPDWLKLPGNSMWLGPIGD